MSLSYLQCLLVTLLVQSADVSSFFPKAIPASRELNVLSLRDASLDTKLAATTLQGLVNRQANSELYILAAPWDIFWLEYLQSMSFVDSYKEISLTTAFEQYASIIKKIVIYDPAIPATINSATMIASLEFGIVTAPDFPLGEWAAKIERIDLRERWRSNAEVYYWAFEKLFPQMNQQILACYHPTACNHHLRDYLVQQKVFHVWVTSEEASDGIISSFDKERAFAEDLFKATSPNLPVLGFWYSGVDRGLDEYRGVGLAGEYGKITIACDWATNLSVLGGIRTDLDKAIEVYEKGRKSKQRLLDPLKIYVCVDIVESGDSPSYVQTRMAEVWKDEKRGAIAVNWSLGPALLELAPPIAYYFYTQATPKDYLYVAISGAGYCHPYRNLFGQLQEKEKAWHQYITLTRYYCDRMRCAIVGLYTDAWLYFDHNAQHAITKRFVEGIPELQCLILGMGRDDGITADHSNYWLTKDTSASRLPRRKTNETSRIEARRIDYSQQNRLRSQGRSGARGPLVSHIMTRWPTDYATRSKEENILWLVDDICRHTPTSRPGFIHVMALSWIFGPSEIISVFDQLGDLYVPVTIPEYLDFYKQAYWNTK